MKTNLLKKLMAVVVFFSAITISAQAGPTTYDFSDGLQNWLKGYGNGTVVHDPTGGKTNDGALTLDRNSTGNTTNNNANIRRGQGGDDTFIVLDADVTNFIKITLLNETKAVAIKVMGTSRTAGGTGVGNQFDNINTNHVMTAESPYYQVAYLDVSALTGEVTRLDLLFRANSVLTDAPGSLVTIDKIEFLESLPLEYSEFVKNPNFEDGAGIGHIITNKDDFSKALTSAEAQNGEFSYSTTFDKGDATKINWNFTNYQHDYDTPPVAGASLVEVKMWVKTNRTGAAAPFRILQRTRTLLGAIDVKGDDDQYPWAIATTSNTTGDWEELTFSYTVPSAFDKAQFWFAVDFDDTNTDLNMLNNDVIYFDNISVTISPVLGVDKNALEGVRLHPNPVSDMLYINNPAGSNVSVYNALGTLVKSEMQVQKNYSIRVSNLSSGLYFLKLSSEGKTSTMKFLVK